MKRQYEAAPAVVDQAGVQARSVSVGMLSRVHAAFRLEPRADPIDAGWSWPLRAAPRQAATTEPIDAEFQDVPDGREQLPKSRKSVRVIK